MPRFQLFVDDSGTREYDPNRNYDTSGRSLYFVYGGILIEQDHAASSFVPRLKELKINLFGVDTVEIKSNWLRIPHERVDRYLTPFGITEAQLTKFVDDYYAVINDANLMLLAAVVNKLHMQEKYATPWFANTAAYEILLQRAVKEIPKGSTLSVTIDNISGKTPAQNEYRQLVSAHHEKLRKFGSSLQKSIKFDCVDGPVRFVLSHHFDAIQAADLVAYNVNRQFLNHGEAWETPPADGSGRLPTYEYFDRIAQKFRQDPHGRIQGYGVVKFPLLKQLRWRVKKK